MLRYIITVLFAGFLLLPSALADEAPLPGIYDPSVCAARESDQAALDSVQRAVEAAASAECLAMIEAFPRPRPERINRDSFTLQNYSFWRVKREGAPLYSAPGGGAIGGIPPGFNFVQALDVSAPMAGCSGWAASGSGPRMSSRCRPPVLRACCCRRTGRTLMLSSWTGAAHTPRCAPVRSGQQGKRLRNAGVTNLVNIFARTEDEAGKVWYLVGPQSVAAAGVGRQVRADRTARDCASPGAGWRWISLSKR